MNTGHQDMSGIPAIGEIGFDMPVALRCKLVVSRPSVGQDFRPELDIFADKGDEAGTRSIRQAFHPHTPKSLRMMDFKGDHYNLLVRRTASTLSTFLAAAHKCFIHCNATMKSITIRAYHGAPQFVQPGPRSLITAESENTLQAQGIGAIFLAREQPHRQKPRFQRNARPLKHCSRSDRNLCTATSTMQVTSSCNPSPRFRATSQTAKARWPAKLNEILSAGRFISKKSLKLLHCTWEINPTNWPLAFHAAKLVFSCINKRP